MGDDDTPGRHPLARKNLGHTEYLAFKLHPDLLAHVHDQAERHYCSPAQYVRQLIIADKLAHD